MPKPRLRGYAVYWEPLNDGQVDEQGKVSISTEPVEVRVHWEDTQKEFRDPMGEIRVSSSAVMCNDNLSYKGILRRGRLSELESLDDYSLNSNAFVILGNSLVESVDALKATKEYYL